MSLVVDASTTLAAVLPDEHSDYARAALAAALEDGLAVPILWMYEVQNGLAMALRRNRIAAACASDALEALRGLPVDATLPRGLGQEFRLAQAHGLTAYDAGYLGGDLGPGARFATNDKQLRRAAEKLGLALFSGA